jgi:hypothetical protein
MIFLMMPYIGNLFKHNQGSLGQGGIFCSMHLGLGNLLEINARKTANKFHKP